MEPVSLELAVRRIMALAILLIAPTLTFAAEEAKPPAPPAEPAAEEATAASTTAAAEEAPIELEPGITPPVKLSGPAPKYTEAANRKNVQGKVNLRVAIDRDGNVTTVELKRTLPMGLGESAVEAVRQWKYKPALRDGMPVAVWIGVELDFERRDPGHEGKRKKRAPG